MAIAGFSINTLTLFGMVLAIGLLVDDAIVVVENVERLIQEEGLSPKEAARKSMDEISGALIAIAIVLAAVFLPMAFFGGSTGVIYRQFSLTLVSAMALSVLVALILTPRSARPSSSPAIRCKHDGNGPFDRFFNWFNEWFDRGRDSSRTRRSQDDRRHEARGRRLSRHLRGDGPSVLAPADRLPAGRGHRRGVHLGRRAVRRDPARAPTARSMPPAIIS